MEIRTLGAGEWDATRDIRSRSFGVVSDADWRRSTRLAEPNLSAGRQLGGFDGDRLTATAHVNPMRQWWHGRSVSMGGVGGVTVAPEDRGRGHGRAMMTAVLELCVRHGHALSMLFPATTPLYRSLGWEHAGAQYWTDLPTEVLRTVEPGGRADGRVPVRRPGPDDAAEVAAVVAAAHEGALDSGPVGLDEARWRAMLGDESAYRYLAADGFLSYRWGARNTVLEVDRLVAGSERTLRALWAIVGSGSSTAKTVRACVAPQDPVMWLPRELSNDNVRRNLWMLRVVDAPAAIAGRGYPRGLAADVPLRVEDPQLPANSGSWRLLVEGGEGRLERAAADDDRAVRLGVRGLSALYAGVPAATLRRSGLLEGGDAELGALSGAFAASPFSLDFF